MDACFKIRFKCYAYLFLLLSEMMLVILRESDFLVIAVMKVTCYPFWRIFMSVVLRYTVGGQTDWQASSQVHASRKKTHFQADISCISLANNRWTSLNLG